MTNKKIVLQVVWASLIFGGAWALHSWRVTRRVGERIFPQAQVAATTAGHAKVFTQAPQARVPSQGGNARLAESYGKLPLSFEINKGQSDPRVKFLSRGNGYTLFLTSDGATFSLAKPHAKADLTSTAKPAPTRADVLRLRLVGANPQAPVEGMKKLPGVSNYFIGNDPKKWRTDVPNYGQVKYSGVYPGVDLVYYGHGRQLEHDFIVAPGASPSVIAMEVKGADKVALDSQGDLVLGTHEGEARFEKPVIYQEVDGTRRQVPGGYTLKADGRVSFEVPEYERARPLVIDPVLDYSTYLGGNGQDQGFGIAVDSSGNAYVTGITVSTNFPGASSSPIQPTLNGSEDAFVTEINAAGVALVYSTYLGGNSSNEGSGIAVDSSGNAYVTGYTESSNFPGASSSPIQPTLNGFLNAFVAEIKAGGTALVYSTYLGGNSSNEASGIAVDSSGNAYVTGYTESTNFPGASSSPIQPTLKGSQNAFVAEISANGTALVYSTYLGGSSYDDGAGIAVDSSGNAYVTGYTESSNFLGASSSPIQPTLNGGQNAFVAEISVNGTSLVYSTYLGGSSGNIGRGIAVDSSGNAYVTGYTGSTNFPGASSSPIQPTLNGGEDAFVAEISANGTSLVYSTYLGGSGEDLGSGIAVDSSGNAYVTGSTQSTNFLGASSSQIQPTLNGSEDAFVAEISANGTLLVYSTYLGGSGQDLGNGIAVDSSGNAYVTGYTESTNFLGASSSPLQSTLSATTFPEVPETGISEDAFVVKISSVTLPATTTIVTASQNPGVDGVSVTFTATVSGSGTPTGFATFLVNGTLETLQPLIAGQAMFTTGDLLPSTYTITAQYYPDTPNFPGSVGTLVETINSLAGVPPVLNGNNTFTGNQTVNGMVTATSFFGSGAGLTGTSGMSITGTAANALSLGGLPFGDYALLTTGNSFTGNQNVTGNVSATGSVSGGTASFTGAVSGGTATFTGALTATGVSGTLATAGSVSIGGGTPIIVHQSLVFSPSFPALQPSACAVAIFTFTGASDGDTLSLGVSNAMMGGGGTLNYFAWVSAANTVTIRACNLDPAVPQTTAGSGTIRVDLWKH